MVVAPPKLEKNGMFLGPIEKKMQTQDRKKVRQEPHANWIKDSAYLPPQPTVASFRSV